MSARGREGLTTSTIAPGAAVLALADGSDAWFAARLEAATSLDAESINETASEAPSTAPSAPAAPAAPAAPRARPPRARRARCARAARALRAHGARVARGE